MVRFKYKRTKYWIKLISVNSNQSHSSNNKSTNTHSHEGCNPYRETTQPDTYHGGSAIALEEAPLSMH